MLDKTRVGPLGKDISRAQKIGGPEKERKFDATHLVAVIVNLVASYFVFYVESLLFLKLFTFGLAMSTLYMTFCSEESRTTSSERYNIDRSNKDEPSTAILSLPIIVLSAITNNLINISRETLVVCIAFLIGWFVLMYVYFEFANKKKKKWKNIL